MTVLLLAKPRVAAEWLVGAAAAFLALDYAQSTALTLDSEFGWLSAGLRTGGAALVLIALVFAWPAAQQRGRPISIAPAILLVVGCSLVMVGTWRWYTSVFQPDLWVVTVAATAGMLLILLARGFLLRGRTTGAAALTAAGLSGGVIWGIEAWRLIDRVGLNNSGSVMTAGGFGAILGVGLFRWLRRHRASDPPTAGATD